MKVFSYLKVLYDCIHDKEWTKYDDFIDYLEKREHFNFRIRFIDFILDFLFPHLENKNICFQETKKIMTAKRQKGEKLYLKLKGENDEDDRQCEIVNTIFNHKVKFNILITSGDDMIRIFK